MGDRFTIQYPSQWEICAIGEFAKVKGGKRLPKGTGLVATKTQHPYIRVTDFSDGKIDVSNLLYVPDDVFPRIQRYVVSRDDVIISIVGTIGLIAQVDAELEGANLTENAAKICEIDANIDSNYLAYYLKSYLGQHEIRAQTVGSTQPKLALFRIKNIRVPIPPLPEQRAIAHILGTLDDKIETLCRMNETLEGIARALFKAWFVDFEPVRAKMSGRWRRGQSLPGLPADMYDRFPNKLVPSELGEIPEGWRVGCVADLGKVITGKTPPTKNPENYGNDVPFITIPDMRSGIYVTETNKKLSARGADTQKTKFLPPNSICVSCIATPGLVVLTSERSQTNQQINSVIPENYSPYYVYGLLHRLGDQIRAGGSGGSVFANLSKSRFAALRILLANDSVVSIFHSIVEPFYHSALYNQREMSTLSTLRDALLPQLISGRLRVRDAEKFLEKRA